MAEPKHHPACLLLPELAIDAFAELVEDIRQHGQRHPIFTDEDGLILDGRHRDRACRQLGLEPRTEVFVGTEAEKIALILSENVHRRHLTTQQRAAIAAELAEKLAQAAKMRQLAGKATLAPTDAKGKATEQAAAMVGGVSSRSVERATQRMRADPEAHAKAKAGKLGKRRPKHPIREPRETPPKPVADLALDLAKLNAAWSPLAVEKYAGSMTERQARNIVGHLGDLRLKLETILEAADAVLGKVVGRSEPARVPAPKGDPETKRRGRPKRPRCTGCSKPIHGMAVDYQGRPNHQDCATMAAA